MNIYLTIIDASKDGGNVEVFTKDDDYLSAIDRADEWVWQYAESPEAAKSQHCDKHDQWAINPDKETY